MKKRWWRLIVTITLSACIGVSCQKWDKWDEPSGNQTYVAPPVVVDAAYSNVSEPTIEKEDGVYYIISSNDSMDLFSYQPGLILRTTSDLVNMQMADNTAYILNDIVSTRKQDLLALDATVDTTKVTIREPFLFKKDGTYYLYYSVSAGSGTSLIACATTTSLADNVWTDKGIVLSTASSSTTGIAACPSILQHDGSIYMVYGNAGIYIIQLAADAITPQGTATALISNTTASSPSMVYYNGYYHLFFSSYGMTVNHGAATTPTGSFTDFTGYPSADLNYRILTPYKIGSGTQWTLTTGCNVWQDPDDNNWYVLHEAANSLHIRSMHWMDPANVTSSFVNGVKFSIATFSPERYTTAENTSFTTANMVGTWYFGTLWVISSGYNAIPGATMVFAEDGTYTDGGNGGTWAYDETTHILTLHSLSWSEYLSLYVNYASDWDNSNSAVLVAAGADMYSWYGGCWMQHSL